MKRFQSLLLNWSSSNVARLHEVTCWSLVMLPYDSVMCLVGLNGIHNTYGGNYILMFKYRYEIATPIEIS
jgi:hypothetical protein